MSSTKFMLFKIGFGIWLCVTLLGSLGFAQSSQREFLKKFSSPLIEFPNDDSKYLSDSSGRYPAFLSWMYENLLSWNPTGEKAKYSMECEPSLWAERMRDPRMNGIQLQAALVQKYFQVCENDLTTHANSHVWNTLKIMTMKLSPQAHPFFHRVVFHLPGDIHLKAILALKGDYKKRPFIVIRLGIFSSIEEFMPERYLLMQLFEQSPFNVLVVENMTSPDFIHNNNRFSLGGYDEGLQNILIAKALADPKEPLHQIVDSVHIVAVSLGGHGMFYSSLLNEFNGNIIKSFFGLCPVVNLEPTMALLNKNKSFLGIESMLANYWTSKRLSGLIEKIPELNEVSRFKFMFSAMKMIEKKYQGGLSYEAGIQLPPGVQDSTDFWKQNKFWDFYKHVKSPVMVWATQADPAVPLAANSGTLNYKNIRVISFKEGIHCTLPIPYQWDAIATLLQAYVLSHSPNFKMQTEKMEVDVTEEKIKEPKGNVEFKVKWPEKGERFVRIELEGFQMSLPLNNFDFHFFNKTISVDEKSMMTRWINQNLKIRLIKKQNRQFLELSWKKAV